jgi:hypothetical protein
MTPVTKCYAISHIKPQIWMIPVRLDMMRVQFDSSTTALLASGLISANNSIHPCAVPTATIAPARFRTVAWMRLSGIAKPATISAGFATKLANTECCNRFHRTYSIAQAAVGANLLALTALPPWVPSTAIGRFLGLASAFVGTVPERSNPSRADVHFLAANSTLDRRHKG